MADNRLDELEKALFKLFDDFTADTDGEPQGSPEYQEEYTPKEEVRHEIPDYNRGMQEKLEQERKSSRVPKQLDESKIYKKNTLSFDNKTFEYKPLKRDIDWGIPFTEAIENKDKVQNLDKLNEILLRDIKDTFGSLDRITSIIVSSGMMIINKYQYYPLCDNEEYLRCLPFDCADYLRNGLVADIFDFKYLTRMTHLEVFKVDSVQFLVTKVAGDLDISEKKIVPAVFSRISSLKYLEVGDYCYKRPGTMINSEADLMIDHIQKFSQVYETYVLKNAHSFTSWMGNNLKSYACNKKHKKLIPFLLGTATLGTITLASGITTAGLHLAGGTVKTGMKASGYIKQGFNMLKDAVKNP